MCPTLSGVLGIKRPACTPGDMLCRMIQQCMQSGGHVVPDDTNRGQTGGMAAMIKK